MKKAVLILSLFLAACGSAEVVENNQPEPGVTPIEQPEEVHSHQPFLFEGVGEALNANMPIHIAKLPSGNFMVAARDGNVFVMDPGFQILFHDSVDTDTFLDNGLMTFALSNDFETSGKIYFYHTSLDDGDSLCDGTFCNQVTEFQFQADQWNFLSDERAILKFPQLNESGQHNGAGMVMGPDDRLYLTTGDGNPPQASESPSQDLGLPLGKILAIDPLDDSVQTMARGLRNPFTSAAIPGGFVIGDVGGDSFEEINLFSFGNSDENYGYPLEEGHGDDFLGPVHGYTHCDETFIDEDPFDHEDAHAHELKAVQTKNHNGVIHPCGDTVIAVLAYYPDVEDEDPYGGALDGAVLYTDLYYGWVRAFKLVNGAAVNDRHVGHFPGLSSMAVGPDGFLYGTSVSFSQRILKLVPNPEL